MIVPRSLDWRLRTRILEKAGIPRKPRVHKCLTACTAACKKGKEITLHQATEEGSVHAVYRVEQVRASNFRPLPVLATARGLLQFPRLPLFPILGEVKIESQDRRMRSFVISQSGPN